MESKEVNWDYKKRLSEQRHETLRWFMSVFGIVAIVCSIVWGLVIYNLEAVKHPVEYNVETNYNRERK